MGKFKTGIALIVALCLLMLFAFLPSITAKITDISQKNRGGSSEITPVSLNLSSANGQLSIVEKILLLKDGTSYPIAESEATSTASDALGWVENIVEQYMNMHDFSGIEVPHYQVLPSLCIDEKNPEKHCVIWAIMILNEGMTNQHLTFVADDETGTILGVDYFSAGMEERNGLEYAIILDSLCEIYLGQLNVAEVENVDREPIENTPAEPDSSYAQRQFMIWDAEGNQVTVEFIIESNGSFYTNFVN